MKYTEKQARDVFYNRFLDTIDRLNSDMSPKFQSFNDLKKVKYAAAVAQDLTVVETGHSFGVSSVYFTNPQNAGDIVGAVMNRQSTFRFKDAFDQHTQHKGFIDSKAAVDVIRNRLGKHLNFAQDDVNEHGVYNHLDDVLKSYSNNSLDHPKTRERGLTDQEKLFYETMNEKHGIDNRIEFRLKEDPNFTTREAMSEIKDIYDKDLTGIDHDAFQLRQMSSALREARRRSLIETAESVSGSHLVDVLGESKYKNLQIAQEVVTRTTASGTMTDQRAIFEMAHVFQTSPLLKEKLNIASSTYSGTHDTNFYGRMVSKLNQVVNADMRDENHPVYGQYVREREYVKSFGKMTNAMGAEHRELGVTNHEYVDIAERERHEGHQPLVDHSAQYDEHTGLRPARNDNDQPMSPDERNAIADHAQKFSQEKEAVEEAWTAHKDALLRGRDPEHLSGDTLRDKAPIQPNLVIRNDILHTMIEEDPQKMEEMTNDIRAALRDYGSDEKGLEAAYKKIAAKYGVTEHAVFGMAKQLTGGEATTALRTVIRPAAYDTSNDLTHALWAQEGRRGHIPGSKVAHVYKGFDMKTGRLTLEAEHALASDVKVQMDVDVNHLAKIMNDRMGREAVAEEMHESNAQAILKGFVEVKYKQEYAQADLKEGQNEWYYKLITEREGHIKKVADANGIELGKVRTVTVDPKNIITAYNNFMSQAGNGNENIGKLRLPKFLQTAMSSHSNWLKNAATPQELASIGYMGLVDAVEGLSGQTVDLTDEGFQREWELAGKTDEQIGSMMRDLEGKGLQERLDDYLFTKVVSKMNQAYFADKDFARDATSSLIRDIYDDIHVGNENAAQFYGDPQRYNMNGRDIGHEIKHRVQNADKTIRRFPWMQDILKMSPAQINENLRQQFEQGNDVMSFDDYMSKLARDLEQQGNDQMAPSEQDIQDMFENDLTPAEIHNRAADMTLKGAAVDDHISAAGLALKQGVYMDSTSSVQTMIDASHALGNEKLPATVYYENRNRPALIYKGNDNEILAELQDMGKTIKIVNTAKDAQTIRRGDQVEPLPAYGGEPIQDIGAGGNVRREFPGVYEEVQRKGRGITQSDPSETVDLIKELQKGQMKATFLDMETTGVDNSALPKEVLQPIEIYAQKAQWNRRSNNFFKSAGGRDYVVRGADGKLGVEDMHIIVTPNAAMQDHLENVINHDTFQMGDYNVMDYERELGAGRAAQLQGQRYRNKVDEWLKTQSPEVNNAFQKSHANFWYLKNIAKYADNENFDVHAGNEKWDGTDQEYFDVLKQDARQGMANLLSGYKFADNQINMDLGDMVEQVSAFVGDGPLFGQNVAEADWMKIHKAAADNLKQKQMDLDDILNGTRKKLEAIRENILGKTAESLGLKDVQNSNQQARDYLHRVQQAAQTKKGQQLLKVSPETQNIINAYDAATTAMAQITDNQVRDLPNLSKRLDYLTSVFGDMSNLDSQAIEDAYYGLEDAHDIRANVPAPRIGDQMFASKLADPQERHHNAEATSGRYLSPEELEGLHGAKSDVKVNIKTTAALMNKLNQDPVFKNYDSAELQPGDVVEHHTQVSSNIPRGVYTVDTVNNAAHRIELIGLDGSQHTIFAPTQNELNRKFQTHFQYIGSGTDHEARQEVIDDYLKDSARRDIARANNSSFVADKYIHDAGEILKYGDLQHDALSRLNEMYTVNQGTIGGGTIPETVASQNAQLFGTNEILDRMNEEASQIHRLNAPVMMGYFNSAEGKARKAFTDRVNTLQKTGTLVSKEARELLAQMNASIKEAGKQRRYVRPVPNKAFVGTLGDNFGRHQGTDMIIDTGSHAKIAQSLWRHANSLQDLGRAELEKDGLTDITEGEAKGAALDRFVMPFLRQQGFVDYDSSKGLTVSAAAHQISGKEHAPYEEYDLLDYEKRSQDQEFIDHINKTADELLAPHEAWVTPLQQARANSINEQIAELKNAGLYHPALTIAPNDGDVVNDMIPFTNRHGVATLPTGDIKALISHMQGSGYEDTMGRNLLYGELYDRATRGRDGSLEPIDVMEQIHRGEMPTNIERAEAMEGLNWINKTEDGGYRVNPNLNEYIFGKNTLSGNSYAGWRFKELPQDLLDGIVEGSKRDYTEGSQDGILKGFVEQWARQNYNGQNVDRTIHEPQMVRERVDPNADLKQYADPTYAAVRKARKEAEHDSLIDNLSVESLDEETPHRTPGAIERNISKAKDVVKGEWDDLKAGMEEAGMLRAGKWIAGLGLAAYAAHSFITAGSPLRANRRPAGHGAAGINNDTEDDAEIRKPGAPDVTIPNTAYLSPQNSGGSRGYKISAKAYNNGGADMNKAMSDLQRHLGDVNVNYQDDRTNMDRGWLQQQYQNYMNRGHA